MPDEALIKHALALLKSDKDYLADAREGAPVANTVVGSVMSITTGTPRQHTEAAVREALKRLRRKPR